MKRKLFSLTVLLIVLSVTAANATNFYMQIDGTKQGKFKGESVKPNFTDFMECVKFYYEVKSPRDVATGQASGKRQHRPITITKEWGAASPQIFQALTTNEVLKSVVIKFVKVNSDNIEEVYQTITLSNAQISDIKYIKDYDLTGNQTFVNQSGEFEEISFTFQKIQIDNVQGKTTANDDWRQ